MNLNKYEALNEHRKMWAWILEEVKRRFDNKNYNFDIKKLKHTYLDNTYPYDGVANSCFMCDYVYNKYGEKRCDKCLLPWSESYSKYTCLSNPDSPYYNLVLVDSNEVRTNPYLRYKVLKWIEEMINLPLREDV